MHTATVLFWIMVLSGGFWTSTADTAVAAGTAHWAQFEHNTEPVIPNVLSYLCDANMNLNLSGTDPTCLSLPQPTKLSTHFTE